MLTGAAFGAAGTFSGTGRYLAPNNWSGKAVPKVNDGADDFLSGHAFATNETETLEGGQWMHIGNTAASGLGILDLYNTNYKIKDLRIGCDSYKQGGWGCYCQKGGSLTGGSVSIGWAQYAPVHVGATMTLEDVTASGLAVTLGNDESAGGLKTDDRLVVSGGSFTANSLAIGSGHQGSVLFTNTAVTITEVSHPFLNGKSEDSAELVVKDSTWKSSNEGFTIAGGADSFGKAVFADCPSVDFFKPRVGHGANSTGWLTLSNCVVRNTWERDVRR